MASLAKHSEQLRRICGVMADDCSDDFLAGQLDALVKFAHWKDGVQYVGTSGKTLASATLDIIREHQERHEKRNCINGSQHNTTPRD
jgi:hypothetical protein